MRKHDTDLDTNISVALDTLQKAHEYDRDQVRRAFYTMGVIENFLEHLSESSQFTREQRTQLAKIATTWDKAVFGTLGIDFETLGKPTSSQDCPTSSSTQENEVNA